MITQSVRPTTHLNKNFENLLGYKFRKTLRKLGIVHILRSKNKIYTIDVPFQLMLSKGRDNIVIIIDKARLPRQYTAQNLREIKKYLENTFNIPIQISQTSTKIAFCCHYPSDNAR